jgi:hypothetical protein
MAKSTGNYTANDFKVAKAYFVKFRQFDNSQVVVHASFAGEEGTDLRFTDIDTAEDWFLDPAQITQVGDG